MKNELCLEFLERLTINRKSENTIRGYRNNFKTFFREMEVLRPDIKNFDLDAFRNLTIDDFDNIKKHMEVELKRKRSYINGIIATLSSFYTFLEKVYGSKEYYIRNIAKASGKVVEQAPKAVFLEVTESRELICVADDRKNENLTGIKKTAAIRNDLMINLFLNTGLRCSELRNLEFSNIIEEDNYIVFYGKGKKERGLYLNDKTMELYRAWKEERAKLLEKLPVKEGCENKIFITKRRSMISSKQVNRVIDEYCKEAGIDKHITSHKLRHTVATAFLKEGNRSLEEVADILGHSSVETTKRYSHILDDTKKLTRKFNPIFS